MPISTMIPAGECDQVRLQPLPREAGQGFRPVPGLPRTPLYGSLPQEGHHLGERPFHHRPGKVHQVWPLRRLSAPTTPSSRPSVPAPLPAAWVPSTPMSWAAPRSITASAFPAVSVSVNCPFGAIADKGQIYQLIQGFNRGDRIYALVAPAFINQFPGLASTGKLKAALKAVGFHDVVEVAIGADLCTVDEAHDFLEEVPGKLNFMATSCCPAWSMMAKTAFPPCSGQEHLHGPDPHGVHRPHDEAERPHRPHVLHRTLRRQEAGSFPPHRPQRRRFRPDL